MFGPSGGGGWNILGPSSAALLDKERPAPPRVLPLEFPKHVPPSTSHPLSRRRMMSFRASLLRLRKPSDVCDGLLAHLNIHIETDVSLSTLVPSKQFAERPLLYDTDLESMLAELDIPNEDAYREIMRLPPLEGRKKPRLAYSRNFFAGLEDMRRYYDDSKDNYYEVDVHEEEREDPRKLKDQDQDQTAKIPPPGSKSDKSEENGNDGDSTMTSDELSPPPSSNPSTFPPQASTDPASSTTTHKNPVYKGVRLSNAGSLPSQTRTATVRNLLKMATHKFSCRDYDLSPRERLRIADVNLPPSLAMPTFVVVKTPAEVRLARGRFVEGPVFGVSVRHECVFTKKGLEVAREMLGWGGGGGNVNVSEALGGEFDLGREVGSLLALAMMRLREGKGSREEVLERESEGWWWTKNDRWGGGPMKWGQLACEVYEDEDPSWSPEERSLQEERRREAEEEMKRIPKEIAKGARDLSVDDLISGEKKKKKKKDGEKVTAATDGGEKGRSERGPPKKKNRIEIASHLSGDNTTQSDNSTNTSLSSELLTPAGPIISSSSNSQSNTQSASTATTNSTRNRNNTNSSNTKSKPKEEDFHDGRRVMYVAPMRRRWYREWTGLRGNGSTWDEKVIWKRIGGPSFATTAKPGGTESAGGGDADESAEKGEQDMTVRTEGEDLNSASAQWDEIYQISSVNHHVAITKMRVSKRYLRWLGTGDVEDNTEAESQGEGGRRGPSLPNEERKEGGLHIEGRAEDIIKIQRSRWFDMFDVEERKEFLVGLWRVMCWLCRDEVSRG